MTGVYIAVMEPVWTGAMVSTVQRDKVVLTEFVELMTVPITAAMRANYAMEPNALEIRVSR